MEESRNGDVFVSSHYVQMHHVAHTARYLWSWEGFPGDKVDQDVNLFTQLRVKISNSWNF